MDTENKIKESEHKVDLLESLINEIFDEKLDIDEKIVLSVKTINHIEEILKFNIRINGYDETETKRLHTLAKETYLKPVLNVKDQDFVVNIISETVH